MNLGKIISDILSKKSDYFHAALSIVQPASISVLSGLLRRFAEVINPTLDDNGHLKLGL